VANVAGADEAEAEADGTLGVADSDVAARAEDGAESAETAAGEADGFGVLSRDGPEDDARQAGSSAPNATSATRTTPRQEAWLTVCPLAAAR
jgi:hypothetical protein